jgi:hypothetical protein
VGNAKSPLCIPGPVPTAFHTETVAHRSMRGIGAI